jgi:DNA-binding NarL/FixJ family response regulator
LTHGGAKLARPRTAVRRRPALKCNQEKRMQIPSRVTVAVAVLHEDPVVAAGLRALLQVAPDLAVPESTGPGEADVVVADHRGALALQALRRLETRSRGAGRPAPRFMIVAATGREWEVRRALEAGIHGYLLQGCTTQELLDGVRALGRGERYLGQAALQCLARSLGHDALTAREAEVLQALAQGLSNKAIGRELGIALGTVKAHVKAILEKLGAVSRTQAVVIAAQRGLVQAGDGDDQAKGLAAALATTSPWKRAPSGSLGEGRREPSLPAMVVAP